DAPAIVARVLKMLEMGAIVTENGALLKTPIDSICVHGDTPQAVVIARELRTALERAGWRLRAFAPRE
ncbi:MAG: LamB/YcsF family protein, partial [Methylocystis sp.]